MWVGGYHYVVYYVSCPAGHYNGCVKFRFNDITLYPKIVF